MVVTKIYTEPPVCKKEILRYAGCKNSVQENGELLEENRKLKELVEECLREILPKLSYKVCYMELPLRITDSVCDFGCIKLESKDLAKNLQGCERVVLFAATIGVEIDRLIARYGHLSPAKALMLQAIGAERIEALCDMFCAEGLENMIASSASLRPRFSPGYGDLVLEVQKDIFGILNCSKNIGLSLNDSLLMSPSKSVTAFVGIDQSATSHLSKEQGAKSTQEEKLHNCASCKKTDCAYRI